MNRRSVKARTNLGQDITRRVYRLNGLKVNFSGCREIEYLCCGYGEDSNVEPFVF